MNETAANNVVPSPLPGKAEPYLLPAGTGRGFILGGQVNRFLATCAETGGTMAVANPIGPPGATVPPHFHNEQHDVLYCVRGRLQVWAGEHSRVLTAGDIASIPPGTPHTFELLGHYTEVLSPVTPCRWPRFFEIMAAAYGDGAYPPVDKLSGPPSPEKGAKVAEEDLMVRVDDFERVEAKLDAADDVVPERVQPYFLRAGEGPRHLLFGQVCFRILPGAQTRERTAMTITEGPVCPALPVHAHQHTYEAIFCLAGRMRVWTGSEEHYLGEGDFVNIPAGVEHTYALDANFNRFATMVAPAGVERLFELAGTLAEHQIFPDQPEPADPERLAAAAREIDVAFVQ